MKNEKINQLVQGITKEVTRSKKTKKQEAQIMKREEMIRTAEMGKIFNEEDQQA